MAAEDSWGQSDVGLFVPPAKPVQGKWPKELVEEVEGFYDGVVGNLLEQISSAQAGVGLGLEEYQRDQDLGEFFGKFRGPAEQVLRMLAERMVQLSNRVYAGQYGYGYGGINDSEVGDVTRQISLMMWVFPELNPMVKQMVEIRPDYVFGQGVDIRGESKKRKKQKMRAIIQKRAQMQELQQQQAQAMANMGEPGSNGSQAGYDPASMGRDSMFQANGASGHAPSTPGPNAGRNNPRREELQETTLAGISVSPKHTQPVSYTHLTLPTICSV